MSTDLLDVAELEFGKTTMDYEEVDLAKLLRLIASHFDTLASQRRISYVVKAPERLMAE